MQVLHVQVFDVLHNMEQAGVIPRVITATKTNSGASSVASDASAATAASTASAQLTILQSAYSTGDAPTAALTG